MASNWIEYEGKQIFYVDLSGFKSDELALNSELTRTIGNIGRGLNNLPDHSALVLVDLRDTNITRSVQQLISERIDETHTYVHKTAVVGLTGIRKVFLDYFARLAGVKTVGFEDPESAKNGWSNEGKV